MKHKHLLAPSNELKISEPSPQSRDGDEAKGVHHSLDLRIQLDPKGLSEKIEVSLSAEPQGSSSPLESKNGFASQPVIKR